MANIGRDRRRYNRLGIRLEFSYRVLGAGTQGQGTTMDVSAGGIRFVPAEAVKVGDQIDVLIRLPGHLNPMHCMGEVVWVLPRPQEPGAAASDDGSVGVRFLQVDPEDRQALSDYVRRFSPR